MPRNVEDLLLNTLVTKLSDWTGISSGNIWIDRPAAEFVKAWEGPKVSKKNPAKIINFPSISIMYMADTKLVANNYGESIYVNNNDGTTSAYEPMGEMLFSFGIFLFTVSKKDQRDIGANLLQNLMDEENSLIYYDNDTIDDEYFGVRYLFKKHTNEQMPYLDVYTIECHARILKESSGYTVDEIIANTEINKVQDIFIYDNREENNDLIIQDFAPDNVSSSGRVIEVDGGNNVIKFFI